MLITVPNTSTKLRSEVLLSKQQLSILDNSDLFIIIPESGTSHIEKLLDASTTESIEIPSTWLTLAVDWNWNVINDGSAATIKVLPI